VQIRRTRMEALARLKVRRLHVHLAIGDVRREGVEASERRRVLDVARANVEARPVPRAPHSLYSHESQDSRGSGRWPPRGVRGIPPTNTPLASGAA